MLVTEEGVDGLVAELGFNTLDGEVHVGETLGGGVGFPAVS